MDRLVDEFANSLNYCSSFDHFLEEQWTIPLVGELKINCDASFKDEMATLGVVVRDDNGLLIEANAKLYQCTSAFEAELKAAEWTLSIAAERGWRKLTFSSYASLVKEINIGGKQKVWLINEEIVKIRAAILHHNWKLVWNKIALLMS